MSLFTLKVWGNYACFTRPEMKVERVSYDVITPSAARGIFEAIYWQPQIQWQIETIEVLKQVQWINIRRNEVTHGVFMGSANLAMNQGKGCLGLDIKEHRAQRSNLILKDVAYRIQARMVINWDCWDRRHHPNQYPAIFERRAQAGRTYHRPYLGCREFSAHFEWCDPSQASMEPAIPESRDLGWMLYDLDFSHPTSPQPLFFKAQMTQGIIQVPKRHSPEVRG